MKRTPLTQFTGPQHMLFTYSKQVFKLHCQYYIATNINEVKTQLYIDFITLCNLIATTLCIKLRI